MTEIHSAETQKELETLHLRFEAKKQENIAHKSDKEIFQEVFRERYEELKQGAGVKPSLGVGSTEIFSADKLITAEVEKLVADAFKDPVKTIAKAEKMGGYYVDELHDRLAEEYYEKFLQFRKLKKL